MTYKNILQKGAFATLLAGALVVTVSCNDDDVSPVLEERVLVKEINLEVTPELPLLLRQCVQGHLTGLPSVRKALRRRVPVRDGCRLRALA